MKLTTARHTVLARLSDGEWRAGRELGATTVIASLWLADYIRRGIDGDTLQEALWTITSYGLAALNEAGR